MHAHFYAVLCKTAKWFQMCWLTLQAVILESLSSNDGNGNKTYLENEKMWEMATIL